MPSNRRTRLGLFGRMSVSFTLLALVSTLVLVTAAVATGALAWAVAVAITGILELIVLEPLVGWPTVTPWLIEHAAIVIGVAGLAAVPVLYLGPVREEIRTFRTDLRAAGTPADERHPEIADLARKLAQQASIPQPEVRIVNRSRPESYTVSGVDGGTIVISRGVIRALDDEQLQAVLAHEVSHLANGDSRAMDVAVTPMLVAERIGSDEPPNWLSRGVYSIFGNLLHLLFWAILRIVTTVQYLACRLGLTVFSRGREFAADRAAAHLTGSPGALASALEILDDERGRPGKDARQLSESAGALDILPQSDASIGLFRTHPSTEARIERLEGLATEMNNPK